MTTTTTNPYNLSSSSSSSSTKALVITSDNSVTTWDCINNNGGGSKPPLVFYPNGDIPISDAAWNHNGQVLATCSALSTEEQIHNNIVLTASQTGSRLDSLQHDENWDYHKDKQPHHAAVSASAGAINSLAFGGKSRYLCVGDESGKVCLWDLKKKNRVRSFDLPDNHPSRQVSLDPTDTFILSLSPKLFSCYKLKEATLAGTIFYPSSPTSQLGGGGGNPGGGWNNNNNSLFTRYNVSTIETNKTAIGTTDGIIHIYDIVDLASSSSSSNHRTENPLLSFGQRNSAISEVAFSAINPKLLLSSDQDGIVSLYDNSSGEWIQNIDALNHSIMAMNMHADGHTLAVGTETGQVLIYDIRHQTTSQHPIASMYVQGPVTSLQFAPPPRQSSSSSSTRAGAGRTSHQQQQQQQIHSLTPQSSIDEKENNESSVIKQSFPQTTYTAPPYSNTKPDIGEPPQPKNGTTPTKATSSSPKQHQKQFQQQQQQEYPSSSIINNNKPKMHVPTLGEIQSARNNLNSSPLSKTLMQQRQQQNHSIAGGGHQKNNHRQGRSTAQQLQQQQPAQQSSSFTSNNNKPPLPRQQEQPGIRVDGNNNINQSSQQSIDHNFIDQQQMMSSEATTINLEEVRDIVRDEVENLKDDVEEAIRNLHMDMISQFHQQSQELKNIIQVQMSTIEKLTEENEFLRETLKVEQEEPGE